MPSPLMTVSFALPAGWLAPKNIVFAGPPPAGAAAMSIFAPQLPQNRLSAGISAPQLGQFRMAMARSILDVRPAGSKCRSFRGAGARSKRLLGQRFERRGAHDRVPVRARALEQRRTGRTQRSQRVDGRNPPAP